ncbi:MAG TPA: CocE/NonD family hydrolase [Solirubrobacterales bacterium]|nr:CocE/NonD family hydrolase [Solirubrobacterales bacterium]
MSGATVRVERNLQIPVGDGIRLAADAWLPSTDAPVPALLSFYPYHKEAGNGAYFTFANRWFAEHGYASLIVDLRGSGCSEGTAADPFDAEREGRDGAAAVEWAAAQPWCDGAVGAWGMSYGGITALSTAAQRPAALRAIAPIMGCFDLYHDWYYPGGCEACQTTSFWGTTMVALQLAPPICEDPDGRFLRLWRERLTRDPYLLPWRLHPDYDSYWLDRTAELSRIEVPTFLIGGWQDVYRAATVRAYELIDAPRRLLIGPWLHELPDRAEREPVDYLQQLTRWWDRWLRRGHDRDDDEASVMLYVEGAGFWKAEPDWPPPTSAEKVLFLAPAGGLGEQPAASVTTVAHRADPTAGACAGHIYGGGHPLDQGPDDLRSLCWTSEPLTGPLEIAGSPEALLWVTLERGGEVNLVVRLCDLDPSGGSALIATGSLKVADRRGEADRGAGPAALEAAVPIAASAYELAAGHRLRVSVSLADFPRLWPSPENARVEVLSGGERASRLRLPVATSTARRIDPPRPNPELDRSPGLVDSSSRWTLERAPARGEVTVALEQRGVTENGSAREEIEQRTAATVAADRPAAARIATSVRIRRQLPSGEEAAVDVDSVATPQRTTCCGRVSLDGLVVFEGSWWAEK